MESREISQTQSQYIKREADKSDADEQSCQYHSMSVRTTEGNSLYSTNISIPAEANTYRIEVNGDNNTVVVNSSVRLHDGPILTGSGNPFKSLKRPYANTQDEGEPPREKEKVEMVPAGDVSSTSKDSHNAVFSDSCQPVKKQKSSFEWFRPAWASSDRTIDQRLRSFYKECTAEQAYKIRNLFYICFLGSFCRSSITLEETLSQYTKDKDKKTMFKDLLSTINENIDDLPYPYLKLIDILDNTKCSERYHKIKDIYDQPVDFSNPEISPVLLKYANNISDSSIGRLCVEYDIGETKLSAIDVFIKLSQRRVSLRDVFFGKEKFKNDLEKYHDSPDCEKHFTEENVSIYSPWTDSKEYNKVSERKLGSFKCCMKGEGEGTEIREIIMSEFDYCLGVNILWEQLKVIFAPEAGVNERIKSVADLYKHISKLTLKEFIDVCKMHAPFFNHIIIAINTVWTNLPEKFENTSLHELVLKCHLKGMSIKFRGALVNLEHLDITAAARELNIYDAKNILALYRTAKVRGVTAGAFIKALNENIEDDESVEKIKSHLKKIYNSIRGCYS